MQEVLNAMKERRSIRKYKADKISKEILDKVIEAGLYAASAKGSQSPILVAITDEVWLKRLSKKNCEIGGWKEGFDPFFGAPAAILVLVPSDWANGERDGSLSMGNLMLAAHALGLGSCWINRAKETFESEEGKVMLKEMGIEGDYSGVGFCVLGYADTEEVKAAPRKENRVFYL